jgi:hypothetical protein
MKRAVVGELGAVRERVEQWRESRKDVGERIPEELWSAAVEVARVEGVYATSKALRFSYTSLKERVNLAQGQGREGPGARLEGPTFVELGGGPVGSGKTVIEIVGRSGGRMRMELSGTSGMDMMGLVQAFWRHEA